MAGWPFTNIDFEANSASSEETDSAEETVEADKCKGLEKRLRDFLVNAKWLPPPEQPGGDPSTNSFERDQLSSVKAACAEEVVAREAQGSRKPQETDETANQKRIRMANQGRKSRSFSKVPSTNSVAAERLRHVTSSFHGRDWKEGRSSHVSCSSEKTNQQPYTDKRRATVYVGRQRGLDAKARVKAKQGK